MKQTAKWLALVALLSLPLQVVRAENYAFLVGASDYQRLPADCAEGGGGCDLRGPKNDISAMWDVLVANGFPKGNMIVLADHLQESALKTDITATALPTRKQIMTRLKALAQKVERGDFVYIHFSGHGAMQPDQNGDETDGLDEVFLPIDIGKWDEETQAVKNAIVDDELAVFLKVMTVKGVKVFAVFDQCNAGTVTRGVHDKDLRQRALSFSALGIPQARIDEAQNKARARQRPRGPGKGEEGDKPAINNLFSEAPDIVSFYAVHPGEAAREQRLPEGTMNKNDAYISGAFSFSIAKALGSSTPKSYLDLTQSIRHTYSNLNYKETPLFEGDLNQLVFGRGRVPRKLKASFDEETLRLDSGLLHGISKGSEVALYEIVKGVKAQGGDKKAADRKGDLLGRAKVIEVGALDAVLGASSRAGGQVTDFDELHDQMFVEVVSQALSLELSVALPSKASLDKSPHKKILAVVLDKLQNLSVDSRAGVVIKWVEAGKKSTLRLVPDGDSLRLESGASEPGGKYPRSPVVPLSGRNDAGKLAAQVSAALQKLGKSRNIMRLADLLGANSNLSDALDIRAFVYREASPLRPFTADQPDNRKCEQYDQAKFLKSKVAVAAGATINAGHCVVVIFELRNKSRNTIDVTGLYMDRAGGIILLYGDGRINPVRLEPGRGMGGKPPAYLVVRTVTWNLKENSPATIGLEHAAFISVEHKKDEVPKATSDFSKLVQDSLPVRSRRRSAGATDNSLLEQINKIAFPQGQTRGGLSPTNKRAEIRLFPVQVRGSERRK